MGKALSWQDGGYHDADDDADDGDGGVPEVPRGPGPGAGAGRAVRRPPGRDGLHQAPRGHHLRPQDGALLPGHTGRECWQILQVDVLCEGSV